MIRPKNETEDLLLSLTKRCQTFNKQTHRKAEETLKFKFTRSKKLFSFKSPISIEGSWMIALTSLEVSYSIFNITETNIKFQLYRDNFD